MQAAPVSTIKLVMSATEDKAAAAKSPAKPATKAAADKDKTRPTQVR